MKRTTMKFLVKMVVFLFIGAILFQILTTIFLEKNSYAKYRNYNKQDKIDVLILGSSHSANGIAPELIKKQYLEKENTELSVFNYSIYGMRIEQMYFFVKEAIKKHTPNMIILETFAFVPIADEHREILARRAFDMLPFSLNKVEAIQYCVNSDYWSYYIPFIKYHTRWKELQHKDIEMLYKENTWGRAGLKCDYGKGSMEVIDNYFKKDTSGITECLQITDTEKESLEKLLLLTEENDIKVLFTSVPFKQQLGMDSLTMIKINNYIRDNYVNDENVCMLDMNLLWKELNFDYNDLYNEGHCNARGAKKVTNCLIEYMMNHCDLNELIEGEQL